MVMMCYWKHIKDIVVEILDVVSEVIYHYYQWNISYKLYLQGFSMGLIEYKLTDPSVPHSMTY